MFLFNTVKNCGATWPLHPSLSHVLLSLQSGGFWIQRQCFGDASLWKLRTFPSWIFAQTTNKLCIIPLMNPGMFCDTFIGQGVTFQKYRIRRWQLEFKVNVQWTHIHSICKIRSDEPLLIPVGEIQTFSAVAIWDVDDWKEYVWLVMSFKNLVTFSNQYGL